jgi:hypothetical protein
MLSESEILNIVTSEKSDSVSYRDEIGAKRAKLMDYYNMRPYGDEVDGRSRFVSSDVSDVVEGMLPSLIRLFTQGKEVAKFQADRPDQDDEAEQKTQLANYVFYRQNHGVLALTNMFKDALLQYTGAVKVMLDESIDVTEESYSGLDQDEFDALEADDEIEIKEVEVEARGVVTDLGTIEVKSYDVVAKRTIERKQVIYENIPPEEFLISRSARDFVKPRMIGHTTPKTRSELIEMGFDKELIEGLPGMARTTNNEEANARYYDYEQNDLSNPTNQKSTDIIELTEMYLYMDADEDGIAELWQVFEAGNKILEKSLWDEHPFAVVTPIPIPHRAIGTCPAEQVADIQFTKSVLVRQSLDNIYSTNYTRVAYNDRVDMDDLFTPRPGGGIHVEGEAPIGDSISPIVTVPQVDQILRGVEYIDSSAERRTGFTRFSQGLDADALNHTATGFKGISDYSQQRMELIGRIFAETGVRDLFRKTIANIEKYQDQKIQIRVSGRPLEIDPSSWKHNLDCFIDVGLGSGDRNEKIVNLNVILQRQLELIQQGSSLSDQAKVYNTLDKLITESGLKDASLYFNDPEKPDEVLQAQNEQLTQMVQMLQQQAQQNPLAEAELIKAQARMAEVNQRDTLKAQEMRQDMQKFLLKLRQDDDQFNQDTIKDLTEMELKYSKNVPGALT